ncbi:MAG: hypothetical protein ACK5RQ_03135 [Bacteroidota bacterium]|jgi:hypothetical protein
MSAYTFPGLQQSTQSTANGYSRQLVRQIEETSFTGIFCLYTPIVFTYFSVASMAFYDAFAVYLNVMVTFGLVFRVIAFNWVGNIARKQDLQQRKWQIFSLILPALALILIGKTKKAQKNSATVATSTQSARLYEAEQNYFGRKEKLYRKVS